MIEAEKLLANPFPGLRPFETKENYLFFGRDGQSDEVLTKLRTARFVAVVGTSGSGKSSLVRAGVLPALFSGHMPSAGSSWRVATFRPGSSPIFNLAEALSQPEVCGTDDKTNAATRLTNIERTLRRSSLGLLEVVSQSKMAPYENLLILADQFEELFRFRKKSTDEHPADEAAAFVKLLLETRQPGKSPEARLPIYVILTMRSDYLGDCANFWGLPEAINEGQFLIPRMTDDDRREAITGPVIIAGAKMTAPLVNRLLNDAGDDPAQLPILQHALMRTWDYWKQRGKTSEPIDIPDYEYIGGISGALSKHADEAFLELSPELRRVAEKLFKSLTEKEADSREGRRPATVAEIAAAAEASEVQVKEAIEKFRKEGRSFLMPSPDVPLTSDRLIDISHESLIRGWQRLRAWVDDEAQAARQYLRLADTAALFPKEADYLRDPALQIGLKWLEDNRPTQAWAERYHPGFAKTLEYLQASKEKREQEIADKEREHKDKVERDLRHAQEIAQEQKRRVKQLRWGMLLLSLLLIGMFGVTVYALQQKGKAERQTSLARQATDEAKQQRDNADKYAKLSEQQREIAQNAFEKAQRAEVETARQRDLAKSEQLKAEKQRQIAVVAATEAEKQRQKALQAAAEAKKQKDLAESAFNEENQARIAAVRSEAAAQIAKADAQKLLATVNEIDRSAPFFQAIMRGEENAITHVWFDRTGANVITESEGVMDHTVRMWSAGAAVTNLADQPYLATQTTFPELYSTSGKLALLSDLTKSPGTIIWDIAARKELARNDWIVVNRTTTAITPDDRLILHFNHADAKIVVADARTGEELRKLDQDFAGRSLYFEFSPNGKLLALPNFSAVELFDLETGKRVTTLLGHLDEIQSVAFDPSGKLLVTASKDGTARVWDLSTGKAIATLSGHKGGVNSAVFSHDARYIVSTSEKRGYLWEAKSPGNWTEVSKDSPTILEGHTDHVTDAIFSPNDKWVVTISDDRTAQIWNAKVLPSPQFALGQGASAIAASLAVFRGHIKRLTSVNISSDSNFLLTGSDDRTARVWTLAGLGTFRIASAELRAEPSQYTGKCPATIRFTGTISVAGASGNVKYKFVRSDGSESLVQELQFDGPGEKEVSDTRDISAPAATASGNSPGGNGWVKIQILEPVAMNSNRGAYFVSCTGPTVLPFTQVTAEQLKQIMPNSTEPERQLYLPFINKAMEEFGINTPLRQAGFLAEVAHNTAELTHLTEVGSDAELERRYGYNKEFGNFQAGDGARYKGRGAFLIVGRSQYQSLAAQLGVDLVADPDKAASPEVAFRTAALVWLRNGLNETADHGSIEAVHRRVNGGLVGLADVQAYYDRAKGVLGGSSTPR